MSSRKKSARCSMPLRLPCGVRWRAVGFLVTVCAGHHESVAAQCPDGSPPPCGAAVSRLPAPHSIAVLFFAARDSSDSYLADGLTEDITSLLSSVMDVQVKAP